MHQGLVLGRSVLLRAKMLKNKIKQELSWTMMLVDGTVICRESKARGKRKPR